MTIAASCRPFGTLLVANRGEIALRILRTARALGYRTVAVYSEADAEAPHARLADAAVCIGPAPAASSYLDIEALLEAARRTGADALHPGYGFLAENPALARRCAEAGLVFVGPPVEAIRLMGDKAEAKARMAAAGVPTVPGFASADQQPAGFDAAAARLGFPLLVKAVAGGGGRGMRLVRRAEELAGALASARAEAAAAFGDDRLLLERLVEQARHIEIQVFADTSGATIHLGERECSAQRRHQKVLEEAPSPVVDPKLRARLGQAALAAARAIGYVGAGTVEFLLDADGGFYFLEMNTRLQVEHPVTELITGLDLVAWQLQVAAGEPLPLRQEQVCFSGHAIEARLYAEDPARDFLPQTGRVLRWQPPEDRVGIRLDEGIANGQQITSYYDPLLAKIIAHGPCRETCRRRLCAALADTVLLGVQTNREFLVALLREESFVRGELTTATLDQAVGQGGLAPLPAGDEAWAVAALLASLPAAGRVDPWRSAGTARWHVTLELAGQRREHRVACAGQDRYRVQSGAGELALRLWAREEQTALVEVEGVTRPAAFARDGEALWLHYRGRDLQLRVPQSVAIATADDHAAERRLLAPISGQVLAVLKAAGDLVQQGETVVVLEAMKMEHRVQAGIAGSLELVKVASGDQVAARQLLATIHPEAAAATPAGPAAEEEADG